MAIEYVVVCKEGLWRVFQCGQHIRVFDSKSEAVAAAQSLADMIGGQVSVHIRVQSATGELELIRTGARTLFTDRSASRPRTPADALH